MSHFSGTRRRLQSQFESLSCMLSAAVVFSAVAVAHLLLSILFNWIEASAGREKEMSKSRISHLCGTLEALVCRVDLWFVIEWLGYEA